MFRSLWFFLQLGVVIAALAWVLRLPGEVVLTAGPYRLETTATTAAIGGVALIWLVVSILRLGDWLRAWPGRYRQYQTARGFRALTRGFVAIAIGDAHLAKTMGQRAGRLLPGTPLKHLLLAQAEQLQGNRQGAAKHFTALAAEPETRVLGLRGQLKQAIQDQDYDRALILARQAHEEMPQSLAVMRDLFFLEARAHHWPAAEKLLRRLMTGKIIPADQAREFMAAILVAQAQNCEKDGAVADAARLYKRAFTQKPDFIPAALGHLDDLWRRGWYFRAERHLLRLWPQIPHPDFARLLLEHYGARPGRLEKILARLLTITPEQPAVLRLLVETALQRQLWAAGLRYGAALWQAAPSKPHYQLLQRFLAALPRDVSPQEQAALRQNLQDRIAQSGLMADAAWLCGSCQHQSAQWTAVCGNCGEFASMAWQQRQNFRPRLVHQIAND
jgi:HemY protein